MEKKFRIKMEESFKDGNVLGGKFLKVGDFVIVSERDSELIRNSGGLFDVIEQVIPNPLKKVEVPEERPDLLVKPEEQAIAQPLKRKPGRPSGNAK